MESFVTLFVFYSAIIFGFQNARYLSSFVGEFLGTSDERTAMVISAVVLAVLFGGLAQAIRRWAIPTGDVESGCLAKIITFTAGAWLLGVLFLKMQVYLGQIAPIGLATGANESNPVQFLVTLLKHEGWVDALINFWFSEKAPYLFYQIIVKSITS